MKIEQDLISALKLLPNEAKDKLILRLLKNNIPLIKKLHFELVDTDSAKDKREQVKSKITEMINLATKNYYSTGILLIQVREISAIISSHVATTKDKIGEISLSLYLISYVLEKNNDRIANDAPNKAYTLCIYIIARLYKILTLIQKQHEDLHIEFSDDMHKIGELITNNQLLQRIAINNALDVNWLIQNSIPEKIELTVKHLRNNGFLK